MEKLRHGEIKNFVQGQANYHSYVPHINHYISYIFQSFSEIVG